MTRGLRPETLDPKALWKRSGCQGKTRENRSIREILPISRVDERPIHVRPSYETIRSKAAVVKNYPPCSLTGLAFIGAQINSSCPLNIPYHPKCVLVSRFARSHVFVSETQGVL